MGAPLARDSHQDNHSGGQGESTSNTLVSLYLILLTFFIAMQALADKSQTAGHAVMESVKQAFGGVVIGERGIASGDGAQGGVAAALDDLVRRQVGLNYDTGQASRDVRTVLAAPEYFFAPSNTVVRGDRLAVIKDFADILDEAEGTWRLDILMPHMAAKRDERLFALRDAFIAQGGSEEAILIGQNWVKRRDIQLRFTRIGAGAGS